MFLIFSCIVCFLFWCEKLVNICVNIISFYFSKKNTDTTNAAPTPYQEPQFHQYNTFLPPTFNPDAPSSTSSTTYQPPPADSDYPPPSAPPPPTQKTPLMDAVNALPGASAPPPYNPSGY